MEARNRTPPSWLFPCFPELGNGPSELRSAEIDLATMTFGSILIDALSALAVFGVTTSTVYSLMVAVGVLRFRRRAAAAGTRRFQPPVSVLKPLHGDEPNLEENLASFFQQDYPEYEILFCARKSDDPSLETARRVAARFPRVQARILVCGEPPCPHAATYTP